MKVQKRPPQDDKKKKGVIAKMASTPESEKSTFRKTIEGVNTAIGKQVYKAYKSITGGDKPKPKPKAKPRTGYTVTKKAKVTPKKGGSPSRKVSM